jgi:uncharacterized protein YcnI
MAKRVLPVIGAAVGGLLIMAWSVVPAAAHVSVKADQAVAGGYSVLTFGVPHGCEGSPTTKIAIKIPESITSVKPTVVADWRAEVVRVKLAEPQTDSHGNQVTERVDQVVYTAETPLPDELRQTFDVQVKLPDDAAGTTLTFPTVQSCVKGETAWIQAAGAGQNADELDHPAPSVEVVGEPPAEAAAGDQAAASPDWTGPAGLAAGLAGLVLGGIALARTRRSRTTQ